MRKNKEKVVGDEIDEMLPLLDVAREMVLPPQTLAASAQKHGEFIVGRVSQTHVVWSNAIFTIAMGPGPSGTVSQNPYDLETLTGAPPRPTSIFDNFELQRSAFAKAIANGEIPVYSGWVAFLDATGRAVERPSRAAWVKRWPPAPEDNFGLLLQDDGSPGLQFSPTELRISRSAVQRLAIKEKWPGDMGKYQSNRAELQTIRALFHALEVAIDEAAAFRKLAQDAAPKRKDISQPTVQPGALSYGGHPSATAISDHLGKLMRGSQYSSIRGFSESLMKKVLLQAFSANSPDEPT